MAFSPEFFSLMYTKTGESAFSRNISLFLMVLLPKCQHFAQLSIAHI